jgi:ABC-2 type transport system ATP-binding protein/lipopolysaccharide transport system ATP-binding protein
MNDAAVTVSNVSVKYLLVSERPKTLQEYFINFAHGKRHERRDFWALKNISFEIAKGESLGIIGSNGAGKSTLLKVVSGVMEPTEGEVRVDGKIAPMIELGAGFDFELTGHENIYLNASLMGLRKKEIDRKWKAIVAFSELGDFIYSPLKSYSSGMVARLAFAIATEMEPEILVVDEVLSVGDEQFRKKCYARIDRFMKDGMNLILVSHNISDVERLCGRTLWLESGKVRCFGEAAFVSRTYLVSANEKVFEDVPWDHPYRKSIEALFLHGVTIGISNEGKRYYNPNNNITRAELAVFLSRALRMKGYENLKQIFVDVPEEHWAYKNITSLAKQRIMKGYVKEDGAHHFYPEDQVLPNELKGALRNVTSGLDESLLPPGSTPITRGEAAYILCDVLKISGGEDVRI